MSSSSPTIMTRAPERRTPDLPEDQAAGTLIVFAFMWAMFTLFHQAKPAFWTRTPVEALQTAAAIAVLFRPASLTAFLSLVVLQFVDLFFTLPHITNHSIFAMFVDATIVCSAVILALKSSGRFTRGALYQLFAPAVRVQVIILYGFVVLHKLNTDFLSTVASCGVDHYLHLSGLFRRVIGWSPMPDSELVRIGIIGMTLVVEAGIPLLLLSPRTRVAGVGIGLFFHYVLGINIFHDFSGMIFALYLLFLPSNFVDEARQGWDRLSSWVRVDRAVQRLKSSPVPVGVWITVAATVVLLATGNTWSMLHPLFLVIWVVYGVVCIAAFAAIVWWAHGRFVYSGRQYRMQAVLVALPVLVLLNGFVPYVGLKTENSFAMFSNLRTEGGKSNHLFIPVSAQWFGYQRDLVTVSRSSDVYLQGLAQRAVSVPFYTLSEHIQRRARHGMKNIEIVYSRGGVERSLSNAESDPELLRTHSWLERKFLVFREVDTGTLQMCKH